MTALQKIDGWLNDVAKDIEEYPYPEYSAASVHKKLRNLKEIMQSESMKATAIPPHPISPSPAAQQLITKVMPIRDQIACMAMSGMLSNPNNVQGNLNPEYLAEASYDYATAMIKEGKIQT